MRHVTIGTTVELYGDGCMGTTYELKGTAKVVDIQHEPGWGDMPAVCLRRDDNTFGRMASVNVNPPAPEEQRPRWYANHRDCSWYQLRP